MTQPVFHAIEHCRICGGQDLDEVIDVGNQALTGRFPRSDEADPPSAPMVLVRCRECGLVQLRDSVHLDELFTENYGYRSGLNATMARHLAGVVSSVAERVALQPGDIVLDIGCNDGTLLSNYPDGVVKVGIDPLVDKFHSFYPKDYRVSAAFFQRDSFCQLVPDQRAMAITSIAMFYDLENPGVFVSDIAHCLAPDGVWVLEQSYMPLMLQHNSYDTICHEHIEYYALRQIDTLVEAHKMRVFDVALNDSNGGSFRLFVCHEDAPYATSAAVTTMRRGEAEAGLNGPAPFQAFRQRCERMRDDLRAFVEREVANGKVFHLYGASTKGNTILQYCGLTSRLIAAAADRNPEKWGSVTPGTRIPIISEEQSRTERPDYYLVLPWHFRSEFLEREAGYRASGGKMIFPLPEFEIC